ncbi:GGDEF domain-containing protein [Desulfuromonas sp. TF]|uniref:GGDEF domain-containing protein n=1 Tax=Desulfuromonas sp. TF TaxID=1232410 RepID=UPI0012DF3F78|nr:GGDEF domain-containing protein [Desulfuromonas sp. TF]
MKRLINGEKKRVLTDIIILGSVSSLAVYLAINFNIYDSFNRFSKSHEEWNLDDIVLSITIMLAVSFGVFSYRRWIDIQRLLKYANYDSLTGLFNRRRGHEIINDEIVRKKRYGRPLSMIMFDLDHFKEINDKFGHLKGDAVLKDVATKATFSIRATDILIRWGGEEFLVVCPETDLEGARQLAERIRGKIKDIHCPDFPGITASFGVRQMKINDDFYRFIHALDEKLYQAKSSGRDSVVG